MKKILLFIIFVSVFFDCQLSYANSVRVYTSSFHDFTVDIPYIQLANKRVYLNVNKGVYQKDNLEILLDRFYNAT